jgi:serine protease
MSFRWTNVRRIATRLLPVAFLLVQACGDDDPSGPDDDDIVTLTSGVPVANIDGGEDSDRYYKIVVPAGTALLSVETSGGTGDVDLSIRHGAVPTASQSDCDSFAFDNDELCEIEDPDAGDWYIWLEGVEEYDNVTLVATAFEPIRR